MACKHAPEPSPPPIPLRRAATHARHAGQNHVVSQPRRAVASESCRVDVQVQPDRKHANTAVRCVRAPQVIAMSTFAKVAGGIELRVQVPEPSVNQSAVLLELAALEGEQQVTVQPSLPAVLAWLRYSQGCKCESAVDLAAVLQAASFLGDNATVQSCTRELAHMLLQESPDEGSGACRRVTPVANVCP